MMDEIDNSIWTEKYRPKVLSEYYISKSQLDLVKDWLAELNGENPKPFLILYGSAGIGKTTLAHLILKKNGYEIIECNASDTRSKKQISETLGGIAKTSVCTDKHNKFKPTAIILDEIDGLNGSSEASGVQELLDIVINKHKNKKTNKNSITWVCPVICTTNNIKEKKLQSLLRYGVLINLHKPSINDCSNLINKITTNEHFNITDQHKNYIIKTANGDYRQIILLLFDYYNTLQFTTIDNNNDKNDIIEYDGYNYNINVVKTINNSGDTPLDKINYFITHDVELGTIRYFCSGDSNLFFMNFYNNVINILSTIQNKQQFKKDINKTILLQNYKILNTIYESIKTADMLNNNIFLEKNWELLDYFDIFSIGIPSKLIYSYNYTTKNNTKHDPQICIPNFTLTHHTQYNYMRQEQIMNNKKLNIDYTKTFEHNITNIYFNLKRFQHINASIHNIPTSNSKKKLLDNKFIIDKSYSKILDKIDQLLN